MNLIYVADVDKAGARSRGVWSHAFGMGGHAAVLLVNLHEIRRSRAMLNAALSAVPLHAEPFQPPAPEQSEPGAPSGQQTGPFRSGSNVDPNVVAFYFQPGWTAEDVAASRRPWHSSMCGPHAVALLADSSISGAAFGALTVGAQLAFAGELND